MKKMIILGSLFLSTLSFANLVTPTPKEDRLAVCHIDVGLNAKKRFELVKLKGEEDYNTRLIYISETDTSGEKVQLLGKLACSFGDDNGEPNKLLCMGFNDQQKNDLVFVNVAPEKEQGIAFSVLSPTDQTKAQGAGFKITSSEYGPAVQISSEESSISCTR